MNLQKIIPLLLLLQLLHTSCGKHAVTDACYSVDSLYVQGVQYEDVDSVEAAVVCYRKAIALTESHDCDPQLYIDVKLQLADLLLLHTYYDRAFTIYANTLHKAQQIGNPYLSSRSLRGLGKCMIFKNNSDSALYYMEQALSFVAEIDDNQEVAALYNNISSVYCDLEQYEKAIYYNNLSLYTDVDSLNMGKSVANQAYLLLVTEQYDSAQYYAQICYDNYPNPYTKVSALETLYTVAAYYNRKDTADYTAAYTSISAELTSNTKTAAIADAELKLSEEFLRQELDEKEGSNGLSIVLVCLSLGGWVIVYFFTKRSQGTVEPIVELSPEEVADKQIATIVRRGMEYSHLFKESVAYNNMLTTLEKQGHLPQADQQQFIEAILRVFAPFINDVSTICPLSNDQYVMCCLSLLGLSNHQCAACRNVSENAVRTQKSRMKSKMLQTLGDTKLFDAIFSVK